jgi:hypothetical protein
VDEPRPDDAMHRAKHPKTVLAGPYGHPFHPVLVTIPIGSVPSGEVELIHAPEVAGYLVVREPNCPPRLGLQRETPNRCTRTCSHRRRGHGPAPRSSQTFTLRRVVKVRVPPRTRGGSYP